ncbi:hypothetical protein JOF29_003319 [Kribbella aluminosa]|uniref:Uncharacterized protein n=1 Tax=Kribbella aluminosa TaxID=416017 RepID=A0ABS4UKQ9_9ACTN|nr:hypothetical protein [Kribbella aluminosa]MBP2352236.1 hypothetical protein [Kribbella aluminosa]
MTQFVIFVVVMIVLSLITKARQQSNRGNSKQTKQARQNARVQALVQKIQAQQGGNQPIQFQGQFTQAAGPGGPPRAPQAGQPSFPAQAGNLTGSQQAAAVLQQLLQNGRQSARPGEWASPGQTPTQPGAVSPYPPAGGYQAPGQFQQYPLQQNPAPHQPPGHRPPQNNLPSTKQDLDTRVRNLMSAGNEVGAVRLLSDERELGLLEAQRYARSLVTPPTSTRPETADEPDEDNGRYVGSAAFAQSIFNLDDREENVWASGWVDTPEPDDRSDIDELWQTVSNPPLPTPPTAR